MSFVSFLCCCFSCNFVALPFLSFNLCASAFLPLPYCPFSLVPTPSSLTHHPRLLLLHFVLLGNFRKWSRILMTRYTFHNLSTSAFSVLLMWSYAYLCDWSNAPVISQASAWLPFAFISRFKALCYFVAWWKHFFYTYLFCRFDFYFTLFQGEAIRQFHWKVLTSQTVRKWPVFV